MKSPPPIQQTCRGSETSLRSNLKSTLPARRSGVFNIARSRRRDSSLPVLSIEQPANPRSPHSTSHGPCSVCRARRTATQEQRGFAISYAAMIRLLRLYYFIPTDSSTLTFWQREIEGSLLHQFSPTLKARERKRSRFFTIERMDLSCRESCLRSHSTTILKKIKLEILQQRHWKPLLISTTQFRLCSSFRNLIPCRLP